MKRSFIREILEHTTNNTISFAAELPSYLVAINIFIKKFQKDITNEIRFNFTSCTSKQIYVRLNIILQTIKEL